MPSPAAAPIDPGLGDVQSAGLIDRFGVSEDILARYLRQIEDGYKWNQYHNRIHAASVLQMMHMLIQAGLYGDGVLEDITMFACYMSGENRISS